MTRSCSCPHSLPVCACFEGLVGDQLVDRSRYLSSLAGWPSPKIGDASIADVLATYGKPRPPSWPPWLSLPRVMPAITSTPTGCGCGRA